MEQNRPAVGSPGELPNALRSDVQFSEAASVHADQTALWSLFIPIRKGQRRAVGTQGELGRGSDRARRREKRAFLARCHVERPNAVIDPSVEGLAVRSDRR